MAPVMGRRAKVIVGSETFDHLLDKGYHDGEAIALCEEHGIRTLISQPSASRSGDIPTLEFYNDKFRYDKETDEIILLHRLTLPAILRPARSDKKLMTFVPFLKCQSTLECNNKI